MRNHVLAIDEGATSCRAIVFDETLQVVSGSQQEFPHSFAGPGRVEGDPEDLWRTSVAAMLAVILAGLLGNIVVSQCAIWLVIGLVLTRGAF